MSGDDFGVLKEAFKYFLAAFIYPLSVFYMKKFRNEQDNMKSNVQDHKVKIAVVETKVESLVDDIRSIRESLDILPERIKSDIRDILNNGKNR